MAITNISNSGALMTADVSVGNAPPSTATISLSTNSLSNACAKGTDAPNQSFKVWNSGEGTLDYTVNDNTFWLSCSPSSGDSSGEHDTIVVSYTTAGLSLGNYSAVITVSAPRSTNKKQTINVSLRVANANLTRIDLVAPWNGSTLFSPPTFTWMADGGLRDVFVVDLGYSPTGPFYSTQIINGTSWTMPASTWSRVSSGSQVYWRVRGADLNVKPRVIITSTQVWSFYKQ